MASKIEIESFLKINYYDVEIGKLYCHSKEWEQCWQKTVRQHGQVPFRYHNPKKMELLDSVSIDMDFVFLLLNKELDKKSKNTVIYTILYNGKTLYRYFYFGLGVSILSKKPILKLISG